VIRNAGAHHTTASNHHIGVRGEAIAIHELVLMVSGMQCACDLAPWVR
jgi:hypothetical protein